MFYNLIINGSATTTLQSNANVLNDLTVFNTASTLAIEATTFTVTGASDINGTLTIVKKTDQNRQF